MSVIAIASRGNGRVQVAHFSSENCLISAVREEPRYQTIWIQVVSLDGVSWWLKRHEVRQRLNHSVEERYIADRILFGRRLLKETVHRCSNKVFSNEQLNVILRAVKPVRGNRLKLPHPVDRSILFLKVPYLLMTHCRDGDKLLGTGGMGKAKLAIDLKHLSIKVVKIIRQLQPCEESQLTIKRRYEYELQSLCRDKTGIVQCEDYCKSIVTKNGKEILKFYYILEYCSAGDLYDFADKGNSSAIQIFSFIADLLLGLRYIHNRGIKHLDLKDENVFLCDDGAGLLRAKIGDFGLSTTRRFAYFVNRIGTRGNWAPEYCWRLLHPNLTQNPLEFQQRDIWAFGIIVFQLMIMLWHGKGISMPHFLTGTIVNIAPHELEYAIAHLSQDIIDCKINNYVRVGIMKPFLRKLLMVNPLLRYSADMALIEFADICRILGLNAISAFDELSQTAKQLKEQQEQHTQCYRSVREVAVRSK